MDRGTARLPKVDDFRKIGGAIARIRCLRPNETDKRIQCGGENLSEIIGARRVEEIILARSPDWRMLRRDGLLLERAVSSSKKTSDAAEESDSEMESPFQDESESQEEKAAATGEMVADLVAIQAAVSGLPGGLAAYAADEFDAVVDRHAANK